MSKRIFYTILFLITIFQQNSCNCPHEKNEGNFYLTSEDKSIVPYIGNETLKFKNLLGDSIILNLNGRHSYMDEFVTPDNNSDECLESYCFMEREETYFISDSDPNGLTRISLHKNKNYYSRFSLYFSLKNISNFCVSKDCFFSSMNFYYSMDSIMTPTDSIIIGNKLFNSVYEFLGTQNNIVYYSINKGVVGIKDSNGHDWYLVE